MLMTTDLEPVTSLDDAITNPGPDPKRYRPYIPTILMTRCSFFPSFGDEEVKDEESQEQLLIAEEMYAMVSEITGNILRSKEVVNESPLLPDVQRLHNLMLRIFEGVNRPYESAFSWAPVGFLLQMFIHVGLVLHFLIIGLIHGDENVYSTQLGEDQNKVFDPEIKGIVVLQILCIIG